MPANPITYLHQQWRQQAYWTRRIDRSLAVDKRLKTLEPAQRTMQAFNSKKNDFKTLDLKLSGKANTLNALVNKDLKGNNPKPKLANTSTHFHGIDNNYALYLRLRHYELYHHTLSPSLASLKLTLKKQLNNQLTAKQIQENNKKAEDDLAHLPKDTNEQWLKDQAALTEFATAWYATQCIEDFKIPAQEEAELNEKDHGWFLAPDEDEKQDLNDDAKNLGELESALDDDLKKQYEHDKQTTSLIQASETRLHQLESLRLVLQKSNDLRLRDEYEKQRELLQTELKTLQKRLKEVHKPTGDKSPLLEPVKAAARALANSKNDKSFQVGTNNYMYHWVKQKNGSLKREAVLDANNKPLEYNPIHFKNYLKKHLSEQPDSIKSIKPKKDGSQKITFANSDAKEKFLQGYRSYMTQKEQESQKYQGNTDNPATAELTNPPAEAKLVNNHNGNNNDGNNDPVSMSLQ